MVNVAAFIVLAIVVEGIVEYARTFITMDNKTAAALQAMALILGIFLCIVAGEDIFARFGITFAVPYLGSVLTGVFASRGANYASDIIGKITSVGKEA